ncbi:hypothetical protein Hanom_Chr01g00092311 [Helianthus anomalus]
MFYLTPPTWPFHSLQPKRHPVQLKTFFPLICFAGTLATSLVVLCNKDSVEISSSTFSVSKDADLRRLSHASTALLLTRFSSASRRTAWICSKSSLRLEISPSSPLSRASSWLATEPSIRTTSFTRAETSASAMITISK